MKIIFMGTPQFAVPSLKALYKSGYNIDLVITQKDRPRGRGKKLQYTAVKEAALELDLEVYQPDNINSSDSIDIIRKIKPDFVVVAAYGQILGKEILDIPKYGCINVHASLLPKYRGAAPINWAIINGEKETGITIMEMEEGLDSGDMINKSSIEILDYDDYISLHDKLADEGADLLVETISLMVEKKVKANPQNHSESTYAPMIYKSDGKINWNKTSLDIYNQVRGMTPWPGTYTKYNDEVLKIHHVELAPKFADGEAGKIVKVSADGVYVNTADSSIIIKTLQFPNKKRMKVKDYLAGNNIEKGVILK